MKVKIGVMGSASGLEDSVQKAFEIGREIAKNDYILITGATTGLPYEAAKGAKQENGLVVGISPAISKEEHEKIGMPFDYHDIIIYTGFGKKGRNVINIRACDAVVFVGGRIGTLNEFTIAYDEGKTIGILEESGGMSDKIKEIVEIANKETAAKIIYDTDPKKLIKNLLEK